MSKALITFGTGRGGKPFYFPVDLATEAIALIGRKGSGKTYAAKVWAEGLLSERIQTVIIDPLDVWWGLRSGYDIAIFGGAHGDLMLPEEGGALLADVVVDQGISVILVVDHLSGAAQRRFVADFLTRLFERKSPQANRTPMHLIVDEADAFAPQRVFPEAAKCLGAVDRIVRRGRSRGIGTALITQRPAVLSKDVLTQTEVLISLQVTSPQDRAALVEWIKANADTSQAEEFLGTLAGMARGEAWVWSPSRLRVLEPVRIRKAETFDSSYTPKIGEKRPEPKSLRKADIAKLEGQLKAVIEQTNANDPKKLRQRVRELEAQLAKKVAPAAIPKEALQDAFDAGYAKAALAHRKERKAWSMKLESLARSIAHVQGEIDPGTVVDVAKLAANAAAAGSVRERVDKALAIARSPNVDTAIRAARAQAGHPASVMIPASTGDVKLGRAERSILTVLNRYEKEGRTKSQVAIMTGYSSGGGGFNNALSRLRSQAMISDNGDRLLITTQGRNQITGDDYPLPPPGEQLLKYWIAQLGKAERLILQALWDAWPSTLTKEELAAQINYAPGGGGFNNALSKLRTLELIQGRAELSVNNAISGGT